MLTLKKVLGLVGIVSCMLLLGLASVQFVSWRVFWLSLVVIGAFAYLILPKIKDVE